MATFSDGQAPAPCKGGICEAWAEEIECENRASLPKCPRCNEELRVLLTGRIGAINGKVAFNYEGGCVEDLEPETIEGEDELNEYDLIIFKCPHCQNPLFDCIDSAEEFFEQHLSEQEDQEIQEPYKS